MSDSVPPLPPLSSISDPAVRAYLQALSNSWNVRNGYSGNGADKFLTASDLGDGITAALSDQSSGASAVSTGGVKAIIVNGVASQIRKLSDAIMQSRMWKELERKLDHINTPEWFAGKFGAAIKVEETTRETQNSALAQTIATEVTNINGNLAITQQTAQAASDQAGATASTVTALQTTVAGVSANAEQAFNLSQSIDGKVTGSWSVKMGTDDYVTGFGLGIDAKSGTATSIFAVRADKFAVGAPGAQNVVPFFVQDGKTYMDTAVIANATIDWAQINGQLDASRIDTRGLTIKDANGNILFGSGNMLNASYISGLGSFAFQSSVSAYQVSGLGSLAMKNSVASGDISGLGTLATKNSVNWSTELSNMPSFGNFAWLSSINSANIGSYFSGLAIGDAYIANGAITSAKIGALAVETLNIQNQAVTVPVAIETNVSVGSGETLVIRNGTWMFPSGTPVVVTVAWDSSGSNISDGYESYLTCYAFGKVRYARGGPSAGGFTLIGYGNGGGVIDVYVNGSWFNNLTVTMLGCKK